MAKTHLRVGGYAPKASVHSTALDHFAEFMDQGSDGDVVVDVLYNIMDLGRPAPDLFDLVESGDLTWCYMSTSYLGSTVPEINALEIPYLFDSLGDAHDALDGALGDIIGRAVTRNRGFEVLGYWDNGFRHLTNSVRPITSPADCAGLSIRLQPNHLHEELTRAWGMDPIGAELSAGIELITSGTVDAQENPLANTVAYGVTHRHITMSAHLYGARGVFANPNMLSNLDQAVLNLLHEGVQSAISFQRREAALYEQTLRIELEREGRQFVDLPPGASQAFADAATHVIAAAHSELPAEVTAAL